MKSRLIKVFKITSFQSKYQYGFTAIMGKEDALVQFTDSIYGNKNRNENPPDFL